MVSPSSANGIFEAILVALYLWVSASPFVVTWIIAQFRGQLSDPGFQILTCIVVVGALI